MNSPTATLLLLCLVYSAQLTWAQDDPEKQIDKLPLSDVCKKLMKEAIPKAKEAYVWIKKTVCEQGKCKPIFAELYNKYNEPVVRDKIVQEWVVGFYKSNGHPIPINVMSIYNQVTRDCIKNDRNIYGIKNVCAADEKQFSKLKSCIVSKLMLQVPGMITWADKGCQIADEKQLVEAVAKPTLQPNWRQMVEQFPNDPLCHKG